MFDTHDHGPLTEADLERVRTQLRDALDRLRTTVERTQRVFYEMRLRVAEGTSDNDAGGLLDGAADGLARNGDGKAPRRAVHDGFQQQDLARAYENRMEFEPKSEFDPRADLDDRARVDVSILGTNRTRTER